MRCKSACVFCAAALGVWCAGALSGCGSEEMPTPETSFKASFECAYSEMTITGSINCCGEKLMSISVDSPETLKGLMVEYKGGEVDFSREALLCTADEAYLPQDSFPSLTKRIFSAIQNGGAVYDGKSDGLNVYSLTLPQGTAHITADENGLIRTASVDGSDYKLVLYDVLKI